MLIHFLGLAGGLAILVAGAHLLVRGASGIALHFGLSRLVVGLTVVAFGTSSPELAVSINAALGGSGGIAVGNIVGSNIFNVLGIGGAAGLSASLGTGEIGWLDIGAMALTSVVLLPLMRTGFRIVRGEGALLLCVYAGYLYLRWPRT